MRKMKGIRLLTVAGGLLMAGLVASTASANPTMCGRGETFVRTETKTCPPTPRRGAVTITRVCCQNNAGRIHCASFRQCPRRSTS